MALPFRLMTYNPQWRQDFEQTRSNVLQATEGWIHDVQHIGGTALENSLARPVVDVLAGLSEMHGLNEASRLIEGINYRRVETPLWCEEELCALLHKPRVGEVTHTVLLVKLGGALWQRGLAITTRLSENLHDRQRLQNLKVDNFKPGCHAPERYAEAKQVFFESLLDGPS